MSVKSGVWWPFARALPLPFSGSWGESGREEGVLEPSLVAGGVGTRFQSLAGEVRSCRNWDWTRSSALYHDCRSLQTLNRGALWIRVGENSLSSVGHASSV